MNEPIHNKELVAAVADLHNRKIIRQDSEIGEKTGYSKSTVSGYISGNVRASEKFLKQFENSFGIKLSDYAGQGSAGRDPATVILPTGDVKRSLADYINLLEYYNKTLSNAINAGLIELKDSLKDAESNLALGQQQMKEQILHSAEWLAGLMLEHKADLLKGPPLDKDKGFSRKKAPDGDGKGKGH